MPSTSVPWRAWFGDTALPLRFPDGWEVQTLAMAEAPAVGGDAIERALARPIGCAPLRDLARNRRRVAIVVDDLSRPTPAGAVLPAVLDHLAAGGVRDDQIDIVVSQGSHTALSPEQIALKVGAGVARRLRAENHDCLGALADTGLTVGDVPVRINPRFLAADLRILVGSVVPHGFAGFSGGAKMVLPGLANIESIEWTHRAVLMGAQALPGSVGENRYRVEFSRVARHVGVQFCLHVVVNARREIAGLFAGDLDEAHAAAAAFARALYATPPPVEPVDVVVLNAYPKDDELLQAENAFLFHLTAPGAYLAPGGLVLLTSACSLGMGHHGLFGPGQRLYRKPMRRGFLGRRDLAAFAPGVTAEEFHQVYWDRYPHFATWEGTLEFLARRGGPGTRVAVVPCGSLQIAGPVTGPGAPAS